jgi:serine/threonine protein kinase
MDRASWEFDEGAAITDRRFVLKPLGGGTRFEVYLAWDEDLFALGVAKVLRPDQAEDERALRELGEEAEVLGRIAHPVIVRSFDAVLDGPYPHILIEHLEGPSLRRLIRRGGALEVQQLLPLALHVAGALAYMQRRELVHLDVKPDNIIMGVPPRLIDLSIARTLERAARSVGPLGTDAYMAPEQCGAGPEFGVMGSPSDVWGLGATLYHCVSGERPFPRPRDARESDDPRIRFPQLDAGPSQIPGHVPPQLSELIMSMLEKDSEARPTAEQVVIGLQPLASAQPRKLTFSRRGRVG